MRQKKPRKARRIARVFARHLRSLGAPRATAYLRRNIDAPGLAEVLDIYDAIAEAAAARIAFMALARALEDSQ